MQFPRLHPDTIEEIRQRADIADVISEHVVLRKRGKDFVGLCPFHAEKSSSFTVSPTKQMYFCFGCQARGDAIKFLMELEKRSFIEVVLDLARRYQVNVETLEPEQRQEFQRQQSIATQLYEILASAAQFYQHALRYSGNQALNYLQHDRQLQAETIQQFGLGFAPPGWETLYRYLVDDKRYPLALVEKAGLIKPRKEGNGYYDCFRDRLMIPIHDIQGRVIAFGGRTLADEQPKYLNSPETELFNKGKTLFALDQAKTAVSQLDCAVVVEGYFDAIALHAKGIKNAVASLGTALSSEQVKLLLRYSESKQLILNFDADKAGLNAAERAIGEISELVYRGEVQLRILNLASGKDADEFLQTHTSDDYRQLLNDAPNWFDWQIQRIIKDRDLKQSIDFQQVSGQLVKLLKLIQNKNTLDYYITRCAEILSFGDARLVQMRAENLITQMTPSSSGVVSTKTQKSKNQGGQPSREARAYVSPERSRLDQAEALLLRIYLHCPEQRQAIIDLLEEGDLQFSLSHHRFLWQQILASALSPRDLISHLQNQAWEFPDQIAQISHLFHVDEKTQKDMLRATQVVQAAIACMEWVLCEKRYRHFLDLWQQTDAETHPEQWQSYYEAFYAEKLRLQELERQRQFSIIDFL
jgi:DNA primase